MLEKDTRIDILRDLKDPEYAALYGAELTKNEFAVTLSRARLQTGITQKELAEKLSLSQPYIAKLERGDANPTLGTVGSLLAAQGFRVIMTLGSLIGEKEAPISNGNSYVDSLSEPINSSSTSLFWPKPDAPVLVATAE